MATPNFRNAAYTANIYNLIFTACSLQLAQAQTTDRWFHSQIEEDYTMAANLEVGDRAPEFALPQTRYEKVSLSDTLKNGKAVLAFYFLDFSGA